MKYILSMSLMFLATTASAKPRYTDNSTTMRMVYANVWKKTILSMFAEAGPTRVYLEENTLVIANANCNDPDVKAILNETFGPRDVQTKMREINMNIRCDVAPTTLASR